MIMNYLERCISWLYPMLHAAARNKMTTPIFSPCHYCMNYAYTMLNLTLLLLFIHYFWNVLVSGAYYLE